MPTHRARTTAPSVFSLLSSMAFITRMTRSFVLEQEATQGFLARLDALLEFVLPWYQREGKAYLTIAIGCTGGRHRSVSLVEDLRRFLTGLGFTPTVVHRDLERE